MLVVTLAIAAAVSPLTVSVRSSDGAVVAVHVADADAEPKEVCAADVRDGVAGEPTCAPVVVERGQLVARLDRPSSPQMRLTVKSSHQDWRGGSNAVIAVGLGGFSALAVASAIGMSVGAAALVTDTNVSAVDDVGDSGSRAGTAAVLSAGSGVMWVAAAVSAVGAIALGGLAAVDAGKVE